MITVSCLRLMTESKQKGAQGETIWDRNCLCHLDSWYLLLTEVLLWHRQTKCRMKSYKQKKSKILSNIASFLNSCFTGGEILHMVVFMLGARLTTGSSMRILCPHGETDWRESRWLKCKKKETGLTPAGNSCCRVGRLGGDAYVPETSPALVVWLLLHLMNRLSESLVRISFLDASGERYLSLFLTAILSMIRF